MAEYWAERDSKERAIDSERDARIKLRELTSIYQESQRNVVSQLEKIYEQFSTDFGLDRNALNELISGVDLRNFYNVLGTNLSVLGFDDKAIKSIISKYPQITRLEALQENLYNEVIKTVPEQLTITQELRENIARETFTKTQTQLGLQGIETFADVDDQAIEAILNKKWEGAFFSERVWRNTNKLAKEMVAILGQKAATGESYQKTARRVRERFDVGRKEALRLVRTESNYINNQAELLAYVEDDVGEYEYLAELDDRTSEVCDSLNGKIFKVADAVVGDNYPPMHPHCRSTTVAVISSIGTGTKNNIEDVAPSEPVLGDPAESVEELEDRWGSIDAKTYEPIQVKLNQGGDVALNAESEWIMNRARAVEDPEIKDRMLERLDILIENSQSENHKKQIQMVKNYIDFPNLKASMKAVNGDMSVLLDREQKLLSDRYTLSLKEIKRKSKTQGEMVRSRSGLMGAKYEIRVYNSKQKDYVFSHEFGHFVDQVVKDNDRSKWNELESRFRGALSTEQGINEVKNSVYDRILQQLELDPRDFTQDNFLSLMSGSRVELNGDFYRLTAKKRNYLLSMEEIYAEVYAVYKQNPEKAVERYPALTDIITELEDSALKLIN